MIVAPECVCVRERHSVFPISVDNFPTEWAAPSCRGRVSSGVTVCTVLNKAQHQGDREGKQHFYKHNNIEQEWNRASLNMCLERERLRYINILPSPLWVLLLRCVYWLLGETEQRRPAAGRALVAFVCRLCVGTCVRERSLHRVIQETHMAACERDLRHCRRAAARGNGAGWAACT